MSTYKNELNFSKFISLLNEKNLKATKQRLYIMNYLSKTKSHPNASMIMNYLKENGIKVSLASVYNVLEDLTNAKIINKVILDTQGFMRYDMDTNFHIHIFDKENNEIHDIYDLEISNLIYNKTKTILKNRQIKNTSLILEI